jgi:hypothetical protein
VLFDTELATQDRLESRNDEKVADVPIEKFRGIPSLRDEISERFCAKHGLDDKEDPFVAGKRLLAITRWWALSEFWFRFPSKILAG